MRNPKRQEEAIEKFKNTHGDKYDYSKVVYINNNTKVEIVCPEHGSFWQLPRSHSDGRGCSKCGFKKTEEHNRYNVETFIEKAKEKYGTHFSYSKTEYINYCSHIIVTCQKHGDINVKPKTFLSPDSKYGCKHCYYDSKKLSKDEFISRATKTHNSYYKYDLIKDINTQHDKVPIICPKHGIYYTTVQIHMNGFKCPSCSESNLGGYNESFFKDHPDRKHIPSKFYIVEFNDGSCTWIKIGISKTFKTRFNGYDKQGFYHKTILTKDVPLYEAFKLERHFLSQNRKRFIPSENFHGRYECFKTSELESIIKELNDHFNYNSSFFIF